MPYSSFDLLSASPHFSKVDVTLSRFTASASENYQDLNSVNSLALPVQAMHDLTQQMVVEDALSLVQHKNLLAWQDEIGSLIPYAEVTSSNLVDSSGVWSEVGIESSTVGSLLSVEAYSTDGNNTLFTAKNIGSLSSEIIIQGSVSPSDSNDFYQFHLNQSGNFSLSLDSDNEYIKVRLLDRYGNEIDQEFARYFYSTQIDQYLDAGTYYIQLEDWDDAHSNYTMYAGIALDSYDSNYGYGLVNANAALAYALGQSSAPAVPSIGAINWGLDAIQAPEVWNQGYTGEGVVVAVLDGGVDTNHSDLDDNIWQNPNEIAGNGIDDDRNGLVDDVFGWDFVDWDNNPADSSTDGHGTHVAGIIAAKNGGINSIGVAFDAQIMPIRVLGDEGGSDASLIAGIYYAVKHGADIINMSLGGPTPNSDLEDAIKFAHNNGVFIVFSAGNNGAAVPHYPADYAADYGISVGSTTRFGRLSDFSNRPGNNPELNFVVAPGDLIYSTEPSERAGYRSGTSMAAPMVSGVAALLLSADSTLTPDELRAALTQTAIPLA